MNVHGCDRGDGTRVSPERREGRGLACLLNIAVRESGGERRRLGDRLRDRDDVRAVDHVTLRCRR